MVKEIEIYMQLLIDIEKEPFSHLPINISDESCFILYPTKILKTLME